MLFTSTTFIFYFLPIILFSYFLLGRLRLFNASQALLLIGSLFFYAWWNYAYLALLVTSILVNFGLASLTARVKKDTLGKALLTLSIVFNLSLLGYFKYRDFFIENINILFGTEFTLLHIILPLAISFFSLQQIAYQVDRYQGKIASHSFMEYALFVSFFPQLIAGPIVHHKEMMTQFRQIARRTLNPKNFSIGLHIFILGLAKKIVLADTFGLWANAGFDNMTTHNLLTSTLTALCYTFQLYFDFSAYSDMAIGIAKMFNIDLPRNFNSPYKATNLIDFWRNWHMTLSRFLRDYLYIPLGGNRKGPHRKYINLFTTMVVCGIWHGATWNFVVFGIIHGLGLLINHFWQSFKRPMYAPLGWLSTFIFVAMGWVVFRAKDLTSAYQVLSGFFTLNGLDKVTIFNQLALISQSEFQIGILFMLGFLVLGFILVLCTPNLNSIQDQSQPKRASLILAGACVCLVLTYATSNNQQFLYFNF